MSDRLDTLSRLNDLEAAARHLDRPEIRALAVDAGDSAGRRRARAALAFLAALDEGATTARKAYERALTKAG